MKIIDENGRLFGKVSIVDLLVVLVVIVLAMALHTKNNEKEITATTSTDAPIVYQIEAQAVPDYVADTIQVGDEMFEVERSTGGTLGKILSIEEKPGQRLINRADGQVVMGPAEECVNLLITVEGRGIVSDDGRILINRIYDLGVNASRMFCTNYAQFIGSVVSIDQ